MNYIYDGLTTYMKQLFESMCSGNFLYKSPEEALAFIGKVVELTKRWDEAQPRGTHQIRNPQFGRGSAYHLQENLEVRTELSFIR